MRCARLAVGCLVLALAAGPASAQEDETQESGGFTRLDSLRGGTTRLDDVGDPPPADLDSVDTGHSESLDEADTGHTESLDAADTGSTSRLDALDTGRTRTIEQTLEDNKGWQPPPCEETPRAGSSTPAGDDLEGWVGALEKAEQDLQTSHDRWKKFELGGVRVRVEDHWHQTAATLEARDEARASYAKARCDMLETVLLARRAGVPPGTLRPYATRLPDDLNPF